MYTPQRLVDEHREMGEKIDWWIYEDLRRKVNTSFVKTKDWLGLMNFYNEVLDIADIADTYKNALFSMPIQTYETELLLSLQQAVDKAQNAKNVKAIYFEYEYDQASFFLCNRFEVDDNSDWAAYFDEVIDAPLLEPDCDLLADDVSNWHFSLMTQYLDAQICSSLGKCIEKVNPTLPIAMAEHDHEVMILQLGHQ